MLKKSKVMTAIAIVFVGVSMVACTNNSIESITPDTSGNNCDTAGVTYSNYVKSVMDNSCAMAGCHNASSSSAGVNLETYAGTKAAALDMSKQNTSLLLGAINHQSGFTAMPENAAKLSECTIEKITAWVNDGAPE